MFFSAPHLLGLVQRHHAGRPDGAFDALTRIICWPQKDERNHELFVDPFRQLGIARVHFEPERSSSPLREKCGSADKWTVGPFPFRCFAI